MNNSGTNASNCAETVPPSGMTLGDLIKAYQTDRVSTYHQLRYSTRKTAANVLKRLAASHGHVLLSAIKRRDLTEWHMDWSVNGKLSMAHSFIAQIRTMCGFGSSMLESTECDRISMVLHRMKFPHGEPRTERLTADQAEAIRIVAHKHFGWHSIALGQAIQFELLLRQRDAVGEWVPVKEPGDSYVLYHGKKWLRGLLWEEIDENLILRHRTSKKQKDLQIDLTLAPMVVEELSWLAPGVVSEVDGKTVVDRTLLPTRGPVLICDTNGLPWSANEYRRKWRLVATHAGVPKTTFNMDSRAGGITEATEAGADLEHVKHAATHSDIAQTQRYSRGATDKIAGVQRSRREHRKKSKFGHDGE